MRGLAPATTAHVRDQGRVTMGEFIDKAKGTANEVIGKAKVATGRKSDNPELIIDGAKQQTKGKAQQAAGAVKGALGDKI